MHPTVMSRDIITTQALIRRRQLVPPTMALILPPTTGTITALTQGAASTRIELRRPDAWLQKTAEFLYHARQSMTHATLSAG